MAEPTAQNLLAARLGERRVTIGFDAPDDLRRWSDARALSCPGCGGIVVLHAGSVRAHHFAHLPGAFCRLPQSEPETEEHRAGKLLLAGWLRARLPAAEIEVEAWLPKSGQRADVLVRAPIHGASERLVAIEFQCASLAAREWRRRHALYRSVGIEDLWLLGGSRLQSEALKAEAYGRGETTLRTGELERALLWEGAPLLFLDAAGVRLAVGTLARFRPVAAAQALNPDGRLSMRLLRDLEFPWTLLDWPRAAAPLPAASTAPAACGALPAFLDRAYRLWEWLAQRYRVTPETLPAFFGLPLPGQEALACEPRLWQAALYYRFIHQRVGDGWWLREVETWAGAYLPSTRATSPHRLKRALAEYQEALAAAGFLSLPMGYGRVSAQVLADLNTLPVTPDREETLRLTRYRRTLRREQA